MAGRKTTQSKQTDREAQPGASDDSSTPSPPRRNRWENIPTPPQPSTEVRTGDRWTSDEERQLRRHYAKRGSRYVAALLGRSITSVQDRALKLGISSQLNRRWSAHEVQYLRRKHGTLEVARIARALKRSEQSVRGKIFQLGLGVPQSQPWTKKETEYLRKHYGSRTSAQIGEHLGRTREAVQLRAKRIGLATSIIPFTPTPQQERFILDNLGRIPFTKLAEKFGTSVHNISQFAARHGYRDRPTSRPWTEEDDAQLRRLYGTMTRKEVAEKLGRNLPGVSARATQLGLTRQHERSQPRPWTPQEDRLLRRLYGKETQQQIAERLDRSVPSVSGRLRALGLTGNQPKDQQER